MGAEEQLTALTPIDGRYAGKVEELSPIVSEYGLIKYRVAVEVAWIGMLGSGILPDRAPLRDDAHNTLDGVVADFSVTDAAEIKAIEKTTNHDVKAVEMWVQGKIAQDWISFLDYREMVHFGCTSEDINNLAYAMMWRDARNKVLVPNIDKVANDLDTKAVKYADIPMLARTHGQPATPTTLGKEMAVFADRLYKSTDRLEKVDILGKFNGASGNYNAASFAYPEINWANISKDFVGNLGFTWNRSTTQIEPHDWMAVFANEVTLANTIMSDVCADMWTYISNGTFKQKVIEGEVGSSTMPHKVNPIDFENAEGNFSLANGVLRVLADKLPIARLQRDLRDSTIQRATGEGFGHTLVGLKSLQKGLSKVEPNEVKIREELGSEWAVLTEAVQTVMRRYNVHGAYDIIKKASRGKEMDEEAYLNMVHDIDIPKDEKERLLQLRPETYIGKASEIAQA